MSSQKAFWLAWQCLIPGSARRINNLVAHFGSPRVAWSASARSLTGLDKMTYETAVDLVARRSSLDPEAELQRLQKSGISYITMEEPGYPGRLKNIFDPPPGIFYRGKLPDLDRPAVALVGSRRPTVYGLAVAENLGQQMAQAGVTVISGMARGIDTAAHRGAIQKNGPTVAVLGCGVDVVYPRENKQIMEQIISCGAVISEFPPGMSPNAWHFPVRNRVISGLVMAVVVVEAAERSGALITADMALEQGRDVLAVPGNITSPMSKGPNKLIKQGARMVEGPEDIFEELGLDALFSHHDAQGEGGLGLTSDEAALLKSLNVEALPLDHLIEISGLTAARVMAALTFLELKGQVRQFPGKLYALSGTALKL